MAASSSGLSNGIYVGDAVPPQVDLVTPLCTQLTYEGLIDEVFGIKSGVVQLELGPEGAPPRPSYEVLGTVAIWV